MLSIGRSLCLLTAGLFAVGIGGVRSNPTTSGQLGLDLVLAGGRVMDPESGLDDVRDVGIRGGRVVDISDGRLVGALVIDVSGYVVAPGFIDLHAHGKSRKANEYQAHDGVTTALELEDGVPEIAAWLAQRSGNALINFGATASHGWLRSMVALPGKGSETISEGLAAGVELTEIDVAKLRAIRQRANYAELDEDGIHNLTTALERELRGGALGFGVAHQYTPGATRLEIFRVFQSASQWRVPIFTHVRSMGTDAIQEVLADAAITGAAVHIVHVNSSSLGDLPVVLEMVNAARRHGLDVTTEAYPYTAASTFLQSAIFDEGWQKLLGISYEDLVWQDTGERLTQETFFRYRERGGVVIMHMMKPEWIELAMGTPFVIVASDGMPYAPGAHPRSAGTFARVLGRYVREQRVLSLMEALRRMSLLPARRLEGVAPQMRRKGRVRVGADADITVFDPETVIDTATFGEKLSFSRGIQHVLVNGTFVVHDGATVPGVFPGRAVIGKHRREGDSS